MTPAVTSSLSAVPAAPNPLVPSSAVLAVEVRVMVSVVALVTTAEVMSPTAKVLFAVVASSPLMSQTILVQSSCDLTSVPLATPKVSKFAPVTVSAPVPLLYAAPDRVVVGGVLSVTIEPLASASVVATLPAASLMKPAATSSLSAPPVSPNPVMPSSAVCAVDVSARLSVVALVATAEVMSPTTNVLSAVVVPSPLMSQTIFVQSNCDLMSVPASPPKVSMLVPVTANTPVLLLYTAPVSVAVGTTVSTLIALVLVVALPAASV